MIYLDTAALMKLIRPEAETDQLFDWLAVHDHVPLVSSALSEIEVPRALRRSAPGFIAAAPDVLRRVGMYEIDQTVRATAAAYTEPMLRSLDAIHLATADAIFRHVLVAFVTYDKRLLKVAEDAGLPVASPGA